MNKPSIETLERAFPGKGATLRTLLKSKHAVLDHPAVIALVANCYNMPSMVYMRLMACNAELEGYGIEHVEAGSNTRSLGFDYVNMGDTYNATLIRTDTGRYIVGSLVDIVGEKI